MEAKHRLENDRVAALDALESSVVRRLTAYANACARGLPDEGRDLLHAAYERWLLSEVPVGTHKETQKYLFDAIRSIRSNGFRRKHTERRIIGERLEADDPEAEPPVETVGTSDSSQDDQIYAQQVYDAVKDDEEIALLVLKMMDNASRAEIMDDLCWDDKKYEAVQRRKNRTILKLMRQGKL